jgi:hypothetical protein
MRTSPPTPENTMTISTICRRCKEPIIAVDEDDLVAQVHEHARDHGGAHGKHVPSREHILMHAQPDTPEDH